MAARASRSLKTPSDLQVVPALAVESDEAHQDQVDGFIARNREALTASIERSREQLSSGDHGTHTMGEIISEARRRNSNR